MKVAPARLGIVVLICPRMEEHGSRRQGKTRDCCQQNTKKVRHAALELGKLRRQRIMRFDLSIFTSFRASLTCEWGDWCLVCSDDANGTKHILSYTTSFCVPCSANRNFRITETKVYPHTYTHKKEKVVTTSFLPHHEISMTVWKLFVESCG